MEWLLLFIFGPPILTLILKILIFIVRYGPGFVGAIFDLIGCVLGLVGCIIMLIIRGIMAVFHGLKVLFFGHSSPPRDAHVDSSVSPDDIEKFIKGARKQDVIRSPG